MFGSEPSFLWQNPPDSRHCLWQNPHMLTKTCTLRGRNSLELWILGMVCMKHLMDKSDIYVDSILLNRHVCYLDCWIFIVAL